MSKTSIGTNTGTNLVVRTVVNLMNDGWVFEEEEDRIVFARNKHEQKKFYSNGDLKTWLELKAEDY